ncbi:AMP-dependent synthetase/ligase [Nocardia salmonicida]|uniref:AMP-dependent synthetase/ligase n=1 Tax=Nocardia salmonicida TaxID=53431 RepID=UPI00363A70AF
MTSSREITTLCQLLAATAIEYPERPAVSWDLDEVRTMTWFAFRERVLDVAGGLLRLGVAPGDSVAILAPNRPEHLIVDLAALHCGGVPISVYPTMAAEQIDHVLADCRASMIIVADPQQQNVIRELPWVVANAPKLVLFDQTDAPKPPTEFTWAELAEVGEGSRDWVAEELDARMAAIEPSDPATIVYTSGTTGMPKGVVLTHENILWEVESLVGTGTLDYDYRSVSHLPLAHIAERLWSLYLPLRLGGHAFCCPDPGQLIRALQVHRPSFLMTVPRVWQKLQAAAEQVIASPRFKSAQADIDRGRHLLRSVAADRLDDRNVLASSAAAASLAREGALRDVRKVLGLDRVMFACAGAAPMSHDLRVELASLGIDIYLGYGMTETAGIATCDRLGCGGRDAVGLPLPGVQIRIAPDGEVLVRSRGNTPGYLGVRDTRAIYTDQWLHTGDIGYLDAAGRLHITDRRKELLITSSGKNIAPAAIETRLTGRSFLDCAVAVGNDRPYIVVLLTADPVRLAEFARLRGIPEASVEALSAHPVVLTEIDAVMDEVNRGLSRPEQVKKYRLLPDIWSTGSGELTPTSKLRRNVITSKYQDVIEDLYS